MKKILFVILLSLSFNVNAEEKILAVDVNPPFAMKNDHGKFIGFDIDLFKEIALLNGWNYKLIECSNVKDILEKVEGGKADFGISGITINYERELKYDFSHPYFHDGGIKILAHKDQVGMTFSKKSKLAYPIIRDMFINLFLIVTIIAHLVWIREGFNGDDNHFHRNYFIGIFQAYYWAIVTSSTVGYGDIVAKTAIGRVITVIAIVVGLTWFADFMSDMSMLKSIFLENNVNIEMSALNNKIVGTKKDSTSQEYLESNSSVKIEGYLNINKAVEDLNNKKIDYILFDAPSLDYLGKNNNNLIPSDNVFKRERYGIVSKEDSKDLENINRSILVLESNGVLEKINKKWFGK